MSETYKIGYFHECKKDFYLMKKYYNISFNDDFYLAGYRLALYNFKLKKYRKMNKIISRLLCILDYNNSDEAIVYGLTYHLLGTYLCNINNVNSNIIIECYAKSYLYSYKISRYITINNNIDICLILSKYYLYRKAIYNKILGKKYLKYFKKLYIENGVLHDEWKEEIEQNFKKKLKEKEKKFSDVIIKSISF